MEGFDGSIGLKRAGMPCRIIIGFLSAVFERRVLCLETEGRIVPTNRTHNYCFCLCCCRESEGCSATYIPGTLNSVFHPEAAYYEDEAPMGATNLWLFDLRSQGDWMLRMNELRMKMFSNCPPCNYRTSTLNARHMYQVYIVAKHRSIHLSTNNISSFLLFTCTVCRDPQARTRIRQYC